jgi:hypothetical protein
MVALGNFIALGAVTVVVTACSDDTSDESTSKKPNKTDSASNDDSDSGLAKPASNLPSSLQCRATITIPAEEFAETESIPDSCQQTTLEHPLDPAFSSHDESCSYLSMLSSVNLFKTDNFEATGLEEGSCPTDGCVDKCLKQFRSSTGNSLTILDQDNFDVTITLYDKSNLEAFEKWCTDVSPKGSVQSCK